MITKLLFPLGIRIGINHKSQPNIIALSTEARSPRSPRGEDPRAEKRNTIALSSMGSGYFGEELIKAKALRLKSLSKYRKIKPIVIIGQYSPGKALEEKKPLFVVIDDFTTKKYDIDADGKFDTTHGKSIVSIIKAKCPDAKVIEKPLSPLQEGRLDPDNIADKFKEVLKSKEKIDGVNMSLTSSYSFKKASELIDEEVTPQNLAEKKPKIREKLSKSNKNMLSAIEIVTEQGIPVYIAGGNKGKDNFGLESLAEGVNTVGAINANGEITKFSANNSLITDWSQGVFSLQPVKDDKGNMTGLTITNANKAEFPIDGQPAINKYDEYLNLIKNRELLEKSENLLDYLKEEYKDSGCPTEKRPIYEIVSSLNKKILGFDSFKLTSKVIGVMNREKEAHQIAINEFINSFIAKYIEKLNDLKVLEQVKFDKKGKPFFDFDGSGEKGYSLYRRNILCRTWRNDRSYY